MLTLGDRNTISVVAKHGSQGAISSGTSGYMPSVPCVYYVYAPGPHVLDGNEGGREGEREGERGEREREREREGREVGVLEKLLIKTIWR